MIAGTETRLSFQATVTDPAKQEQTGTAERLVTTVPIHISVFPEGGTLVEGVANQVYLLTAWADGTPARVGVRIREVGGLNQKIQTDRNGVAELKYTPKSASALWNIRALDSEDDAIKADKKSVSLNAGDTSNDFLLRTDKAVYRGGEAVHLTALGKGSEPVFVDFFQEGRERVTLLSTTIDMTGGQGSLTLDLPPDVSGTLEMCAYRVTDEGMMLRKSRVVYVQPASDLKIKAYLDPQQSAYKPGGQARLKIKLTDSQDRPVAGAISLVGVDEAVYALLQEPLGKEKSYFTVEQKLLEPIQSIVPWSPEQRPEPAGEARNRLEQALFAATARNQVVPALGQPRQGAKAGGTAPTMHTLQIQSYPEKVQALNVEKGKKLTLLLIGWLGLLGLALIGGYISLWFFVNTSALLKFHAGVAVVVVPASAILPVPGLDRGPKSSHVATRPSHDDTTVNGCCSAPCWQGMPTDVEVLRLQQQGQTGLRLRDAAAVAPGGAGMKDAYKPARQSLTNDLDIPAANKPAEDGATPAPRIRENFPETLLWRPKLLTDNKGELLITNKKGEAERHLDIPLADSITVWRLSASAVSKEGQLGATQLPLKVFQSFFVDLNLPVSLTRNDEVDVKAVVYNYDKDPQTVTLKLLDASWFQPWFERLGDGELKVEVKPGEQRAVSFRIKVKWAGLQELLVSAHGKGAADAIKKVIEVVPDGRRVEPRVPDLSGSLLDDPTITLIVPKEAIEGSTHALLKIYPTGFSQVVEGLDSIFRLPSGCFEQTSSTTYPNVLALDYLKRTNQSKRDIEVRARQYIHRGYQRLLTFETPGGGFGWFGPGGDVRLTAYGLMEFSDMARVYEVDPNLLSRTRNWLLARRNQDGSWNAEAGHHFGEPRNPNVSRLASTAYAAWAVFGSPVPSGIDLSAEAKQTLKFLMNFQPGDEELRDPYLLALLCNALLVLDPSGVEAEPYLERLERRKTVDGKHIYWQLNPESRTVFYGAGVGGNVEATALAVLALSKSKRNPNLVKSALAWLVQNKGPGGLWYSTQATVLALKALLAGTSTPADTRREVEVRLGQLKQTITIPADQGDVLKQLDLTPYLKEGTNKLRLREITDTGANYQVTFRYHVPEAASPEPASPQLGINLTYDRKEVMLGEQVKATVKISNRMKQEAAMVMIDLPVPAGFSVASSDFEELLNKKAIARYQVSSGQVLVYLHGLAVGQPLELTYHLTATTPVKVSARGARVYEYYAPEREARTAGVAMSVKARP